jgi:hypothetical protein
VKRFFSLLKIFTKHQRLRVATDRHLYTDKSGRTIPAKGITQSCDDLGTPWYGASIRDRYEVLSLTLCLAWYHMDERGRTKPTQWITQVASWVRFNKVRRYRIVTKFSHWPCVLRKGINCLHILDKHAMKRSPSVAHVFFCSRPANTHFMLPSHFVLPL